MRHFNALLIAALVMPFAAEARAQDFTQDQRDARCALAAISASTTLSGEMKLQMEAGALYYIGKLSGRHDHAGVRSLLQEAERNTKPEEHSALLIECGKELIDLGTFLEQG